MPECGKSMQFCVYSGHFSSPKYFTEIHLLTFFCFLLLFSPFNHFDLLKQKSTKTNPKNKKVFLIACHTAASMNYEEILYYLF